MGQKIKVFFDEETATLTYIVYDENSKDAVIIDPVLNYDLSSSKISYQSIEKIVEFIKYHELKVHYALETHAHADHLAGSAELKKIIPGLKIGIGKNITSVQELFSNVFNFKDFNTKGVQFDTLLSEETNLQAGSLGIKTFFTPGHTPACSSYLIGDRLFTGDTLFMPDFGTGRCDFPKGSAKELYKSVKEKLYLLPDETKVFTGHDYRPGGRELRYESTIGEQKQNNIQLNKDTTEKEFIKFRETRDKSLKAPRLLLQSIQVNIDAGYLPKAEDNKTIYLKIPLTIKESK
jgi:glyoxylase-like metal-dependent hydrolase (beta-lactamase superfamily II)